MHVFVKWAPNGTSSFKGSLGVLIRKCFGFWGSQMVHSSAVLGYCTPIPLPPPLQNDFSYFCHLVWTYFCRVELLSCKPLFKVMAIWVASDAPDIPPHEFARKLSAHENLVFYNRACNGKLSRATAVGLSQMGAYNVQWWISQKFCFSAKYAHLLRSHLYML